MKNLKFTIALLACLSVFYTTKSQSISPDSLQKLLQTNPTSFYKQLNQLRGLEKEYQGTGTHYLETMGVLNAACGNYEKTFEIWSKIDSDNQGQGLKVSEFDEYKPISAKLLLDSIAKKNQIVILNEGHHVPQNRASTAYFFETFYQNGFRYIAMETIKSADSTLNKRKFADIDKTGYYLFEPCYADLVRQALKIGFTIIPYEYEKRFKNMIEREEGQADNIIKNLLKDNPKAKLLMHVGYSHGVKFEPDPVMKIAMMGYFLKQKSGTEPFVIGQFSQMEKANQTLESPYYVYANKKYSFKEPTFLVKNDGKIWANDYFDACLFLPRSTYKKGRPDWLNWSGKKKEYLFDISKIKVKTPFLIQAFLEEELPNGVALDQIEIINKTEKKALLLYSGKYLIRVLNTNGDVILEKSIIIKL
jgi:hypothetical protein